MTAYKETDDNAITDKKITFFKKYLLHFEKKRI